MRIMHETECGLYVMGKCAQCMKRNVSLITFNVG